MNTPELKSTGNVYCVIKSLKVQNLSLFQNFLTDEDFAKVFGMDRDAFNAMAGWKKDKLKKSLGLF